MIKDNSKKIKKGDTFIALKGINNDGHKYIEDAINNGASYIICEYGNYKVPTLKVDSTKDFLNKYLEKTYSFLFENMCIIGITGTNGKTTSCFLIYELLKKLNVKCAYIGTIGFYINEKIKDLDNTTPDIISTYELLLECKNNNVSVVVMEVSSHALKLDRVYGIKYNYTVFTNLTEDHLDFHKDMNDYLESKKKLFTLLKDDGVGIVNIDDNYQMNFNCENRITYGFDNSDFKILSYKLYLNKVIYKFKNKGKIYKVKINMPGKYNIYNSIIGIIILNNMGYKIKNIIKMLNKITLPPGRMDIVKKRGFIIIDYAHTPDAVSNVLNSVIEYKKGKVYTIIGCGGNREKDKRSKMGVIATSLSDYVIFTNDNPRDEEPMDIINDITKDIDSNNYEIILDRKRAIQKGIDMINKNDILLILGKGHENYQIINKVKYDFNDKKEVLKYKK